MSKKPYKVFSGVPVSQLPWADYGFAIARGLGQKWVAKTQTRHMANKIAKLLNAARHERTKP